jgi:hypothetical protein
MERALECIPILHRLLARPRPEGREGQVDKLERWFLAYIAQLVGHTNSGSVNAAVGQMMSPRSDLAQLALLGAAAAEQEDMLEGCDPHLVGYI